MRIIFILVCALCAANTTQAQQPARGTFNYRVDGSYEGEAMEPWSATTTVTDTAGSCAIHLAVHRNPGTRFEYRYSPNHTAVWINKGRGGRSHWRIANLWHNPRQF